MEDVVAMKTTLSPRKNARANAKKLRLKVMLINYTCKVFRFW